MNEYYTRLKYLWEELEDMNEFPKSTTITDEITAFPRLSQFLNGLDDKCGP